MTAASLRFVPSEPRGRRSICGLALGLFVAACATRGDAPAPVVMHGAGSGATAASTDRAPPPSPATPSVVVQPGDSLYAIAKRQGVPARALIERNGLRPPYVLQVGQTLTLPEQRYYTVLPGESLSAIARRLGVDVSQLAAVNELTPPFTVQAGRLLTLPAPIEMASAGPPRPLPGNETRSRSSEPKSAEVRANSKAPPKPLAVPAPSIPGPVAGPVSMATESSAPKTSVETQPLAPPPPAAVSAPPPASPHTAVPSAVTTPPRSAANAAPPPAKAHLTPPKAEPPKPEPAAKGPVPEPEPRSGRSFLWPVKGKVLANYGPQSGGLHNDGINISAPRGSGVVAADNGVVAYAGNELRGFGNLLLIKHADGWVTAYAHNDQILVKRGEHVRRGQPIARVGTTGNVAQPQLHFQLRRGHQVVDPRRHLDVQRGA